MTDLRRGLYPARVHHVLYLCRDYAKGKMTATQLKSLPSVEGAAKHPVLRRKMNNVIRYMRMMQRRRRRQK